MSRTKLLLDVVEDMRALADSLQAVATALAENELAEAPPNPRKKPSPQPRRLLLRHFGPGWARSAGLASPLQSTI